LIILAALGKDLIKIIGPLIRIFSAVKLETSVKFQIIRTLNDILEKGIYLSFIFIHVA
jgi:hypothetical protein